MDLRREHAEGALMCTVIRTHTTRVHILDRRRYFVVNRSRVRPALQEGEGQPAASTSSEIFARRHDVPDARSQRDEAPFLHDEQPLRRSEVG